MSSPHAALFALFLIAPAGASALAPSSLVDPRPRSRVLDQTGSLTLAKRAALDELAGDLVRQKRGELLVVVVSSTGGADARRFATQVFNHLGIGGEVSDRGVLLFAALDDRAAEIILGHGIDGDPQVAASERIMQREMVPRFRAGDPGGALLHGAWAVSKELFGQERGALVAESGGHEATPESASAAPSAATADPIGSTSSPVSVQAGWLDGLHARWRFWPLPYKMLGGGAGLAGLLLGLRALARRRPRKCPTCKRAMVRLGEAEDDAHLTPGERTEEKLGSVDYDIWFCDACELAVKTRWRAVFTSYGRCPKCHQVTKSSRTTTLRAATYDSGGLVRVDDDCKHCNYHASFTRSTPRKTRSSTTSRSSFGSSSGSRGRSSGRGASGRW